MTDFTIWDVYESVNNAGLDILHHFTEDKEYFYVILDDEFTHHIGISMDLEGGNQLEVIQYENDIENQSFLVGNKGELDLALEVCKKL